MGRLQLFSASCRSLSVRGIQRVIKIKDTITLADEKCDGAKLYRSILRVRHGDVSVHQCADVKYGKRVHILPIGDFIEVAGNIFYAYLKPFFREAYPPVWKVDGRRCGNFKVIKTNLPEHYKLSPDTENFFDVDLKRVGEGGYSDVGGICKQMAQFQELVELPFIHPQLFQSIGVKSPKEILIYKPPGSGKPLSIRAVANETIDRPKILSKMAGESESKLRKAFEEAEKIAPSISLKIDKANGEVERRFVSQLLPLIDGLKSYPCVIVMGTVNCPYSIDLVLGRIWRFDREIHEVGRLEVIHRHIKNMKFAKDVDLEAIFKKTHVHVGSDLAALCTEVALQGIREKMDLFDLVNETIDAEIINSIVVLNEHFASSNPSALRETVVEVPNVICKDLGGLENVKIELQEIKREEYTISLAYETCDLPKGVGSNLRVALGDVVSVHQFANVKYGKRVHAISLGDSSEGVAGNLFDAYLNQYFLESYTLVWKGDLFRFNEGMEILEFKVIETDLPEYEDRLDEVNLETVSKEPYGYVGLDLATLCTDAALCIRGKTTSNPSSLRDTVVEVPNVSWEDLRGLENVRGLHKLANPVYNRSVLIYERRSKMKERSVFDVRARGGPYGGGKGPVHFFCTCSESTLKEYQFHDIFYTKQVLARLPTRFYQNSRTSHTPVYNHSYGSPVALLFYNALNIDHIFHSLKRCKGRNVVSVVEYSQDGILIENHVLCTLGEWISMMYERFLQHPLHPIWVDYLGSAIFTIFRSIHLGIMELHDHRLVFLGGLNDIVLTTKSIDEIGYGRLVVSNKPTDAGITHVAKLAKGSKANDQVPNYALDVHNSRRLLYQCLNYDKSRSGISWVHLPDKSWNDKLKNFLTDMRSTYISVLPSSMFLDHPFLYREAVDDMVYIRKVNLKICFFAKMKDDIIVSLLDKAALHDEYLKDWKTLLRKDPTANERVLTCLDGRYKDDYLSYCKKCDRLGDTKMSEVDFYARRDCIKMFRDFVKIPYDLQRHTNRYRGRHQIPIELEEISVIAENILGGANARVHSLLIKKFGQIVDRGSYLSSQLPNLNQEEHREIYDMDRRLQQAEFLKSSVPW